MNSPNENLIAHAVLDEIFSLYARNPYVVMGYGDNGILSDINCPSAKNAIDMALKCLESHLRIQSLILIAPPLDVVQKLKQLESVRVEIYIGADDKYATEALELFAQYGIVRFYKNLSFCASIMQS